MNSCLNFIETYPVNSALDDQASTTCRHELLKDFFEILRNLLESTLDGFVLSLVKDLVPRGMLPICSLLHHMSPSHLLEMQTVRCPGPSDGRQCLSQHLVGIAAH